MADVQDMEIAADVLYVCSTLKLGRRLAPWRRRIGAELVVTLLCHCHENKDMMLLKATILLEAPQERVVERTRTIS